MCGWLLLKEERTFDKVSHLISEMVGKGAGAVVTPVLSVLKVSLICPVAGGPLLLVSASQLKSSYDPLKGEHLPYCPMH